MAREVLRSLLTPGSDSDSDEALERHLKSAKALLSRKATGVLPIPRESRPSDGEAVPDTPGSDEGKCPGSLARVQHNLSRTSDNTVQVPGPPTSAIQGRHAGVPWCPMSRCCHIDGIMFHCTGSFLHDLYNACAGPAASVPSALEHDDWPEQPGTHKRSIQPPQAHDPRARGVAHAPCIVGHQQEGVKANVPTVRQAEQHNVIAGSICAKDGASAGCVTGLCPPPLQPNLQLSNAQVRWPESRGQKADAEAFKRSNVLEYVPQAARTSVAGPGHNNGGLTTPGHPANDAPTAQAARVGLSLVPVPVDWAGANGQMGLISEGQSKCQDQLNHIGAVGALVPQEVSKARAQLENSRYSGPIHTPSVTVSPSTINGLHARASAALPWPAKRQRLEAESKAEAGPVPALEAVASPPCAKRAKQPGPLEAAPSRSCLYAAKPSVATARKRAYADQECMEPADPPILTEPASPAAVLNDKRPDTTAQDPLGPSVGGESGSPGTGLGRMACQERQHMLKVTGGSIEVHVAPLHGMLAQTGRRPASGIGTQAASGLPAQHKTQAAAKESRYTF